MKKILFLSPLPPPYHGSAMSSEMCLEILKNDDRFLVRNVQINYSKSISDVGKLSVSKLYGTVLVCRKIRYEIKEFEPDIIYFAPAVTGFALLRDFIFLKFVKLYTRKKLILHVRGQFKPKDVKKAFWKYVIKDILNCDKVIVLGRELVNNVASMSTVPKIAILPNALPVYVSNSAFNENRSSRPSSDLLQLLFLSNMQESKGWFKVLEACKMIKEKEVKFQCHFVGGWTKRSEREKFNEYVEANNLKGEIVYHGSLINAEKNAIFLKSDILVYPSQDDACPRVILEAMQFGLPIIGSSVGTIPSLIDNNQTGLLLKENNADEISKCIVELQDNERRGKMGLNGRNKFMTFYTLDVYRESFVKSLAE